MIKAKERSIKAVDVRVPATTANLGPGFDCLGMALDIWNEVRVVVGAEESATEIFGEGADSLSRDDNNLIVRSAAKVFQCAMIPVPRMTLVCRNTIPIGRGLGSSAAAVVGGLLVGNNLCNQKFSLTQLLEMAIELEGHADNVAPALLGGCQITVRDGQEVVTSRVSLPESLTTVLYIPEQEIPTGQARAILNKEIPREKVVFNIGRVALLVNSLCNGRMDDLYVGTQDRVHQPERQVLFTAMNLIMKAAMSAGAHGAFLSGSGSTVVAFATGHEMTIGYEMADIADKAGFPGAVRVTKPTERGAEVTAVT